MNGEMFLDYLYFQNQFKRKGKTQTNNCEKFEITKILLPKNLWDLKILLVNYYKDDGKMVA